MGRGTEMANSDSCYSSPAGSLSSIPGIAPRQHLAHSSSQQFFRTFAPGKKRQKDYNYQCLIAYQIQKWSNSHFRFKLGFTATCHWIGINSMVENYSDIFLSLVSIPQIMHILIIVLSNVMKQGSEAFFVFNDICDVYPLQLNIKTLIRLYDWYLSFVAHLNRNFSLICPLSAIGLVVVIAKLFMNFTSFSTVTQRIPKGDCLLNG